MVGHYLRTIWLGILRCFGETLWWSNSVNRLTELRALFDLHLVLDAVFEFWRFCFLRITQCIRVLMRASRCFNFCWFCSVTWTLFCGTAAYASGRCCRFHLSKCLHTVGGAVVQRVRRLGLRSVGRGFKSCSRQRCVTTLGKLFTPMCLCHQAV